MPPEVMEQVARLLESGRPLSRNREFENHPGPRGGQLVRLFRVYSSLLAELERSTGEKGPQVMARQTMAGLRLRIHDAAMGYVHESLIPKALTGLFRARLSELGVAVEGD